MQKPRWLTLAARGLAAAFLLAGCSAGPVPESRVVLHDQVGGRPVTLAVSPLQVGAENTYDVTLEGAAPERLSAELIMVEMGHAAPLELRAATSPSHWQARAPLPDMPGRWALRLQVTSGGKTDTTTLYFQAPAP